MLDMTLFRIATCLSSLLLFCFNSRCPISSMYWFDMQIFPTSSCELCESFHDVFVKMFLQGRFCLKMLLTCHVQGWHCLPWTFSGACYNPEPLHLLKTTVSFDRWLFSLHVWHATFEFSAKFLIYWILDLLISFWLNPWVRCCIFPFF